jgi:hypothetical protein
MEGTASLNRRLKKKVVLLRQQKKILSDALKSLGVDVVKLLNKRESDEKIKSRQ